MPVHAVGLETYLDLPVRVLNLWITSCQALILVLTPAILGLFFGQPLPEPAFSMVRVWVCCIAQRALF